MTADEFKAALGRLALPRSAALTCGLLGLGWRQIAYICAGVHPVPPPVENVLRLLELMAALGYPPEAVRVGLGIPLPPSRRRTRPRPKIPGVVKAENFQRH